MPTGGRHFKAVARSVHELATGSVADVITPTQSWCFGLTNSGGPMSILIATCPRCRSEVNTGVSADEQTMTQLGPSLQVLVLCDECNEYHKALVRELRLASEPAAA